MQVTPWCRTRSRRHGPSCLLRGSFKTQPRTEPRRVSVDRGLGVTQAGRLPAELVAVPKVNRALAMRLTPRPNPTCQERASRYLPRPSGDRSNLKYVLDS